jgi:hypothetical protein
MQRLVLELSHGVEEAQARTAEVSRRMVDEALAETAALLRTERAETEAHLEKAVRSAGAVVQLMEAVLDEAVQVSMSTSKEHRESAAATQATLEGLVQQAEKALGTTAAPVEGRLREAARVAEKLVDEVERLEKRIGRRPWIVAATVALGTILLLTLLRPGWTMSPGQRTALRVGEAVIYTYGNASPPERAEMRRVNRWREPGKADSLPPASPLPSGR